MPIFDIQKNIFKKFEIFPKMTKFWKRPKIVIGQDIFYQKTRPLHNTLILDYRMEKNLAFAEIPTKDDDI